MERRKRRSDRSGRAPLPSLGRPPVADRDQRERFWAAIAAGLSSEDAAAAADVPGGWNAIVPESRRHATSDVEAISEAALRPLSLVCGTRGDRASASARLHHAGRCPPDRASGVDRLSRAAAQRLPPPQRRLGVPRHDGAMARRAVGPSAQAGEACGQLNFANLCAGASGRSGHRSRRRLSSRSGRVMERTSARTAAGPAMGARLEPGADRPAEHDAAVL